ncbi:Epsin-2 [Holothuria leucospilota]|uniref:Epsin-2 n=1 Tax=Holothuria leucospilota TaxID=206669 RepID=A0A9Q1H9X8_HOLLE|nr:Epsin-2 [Holothuria leucospilota]
MATIRKMKNVVNNYSTAEVKVREATSNDPWGPSSSLMSEIADSTYNVVAFSEIMTMIWKRINDHGKNWRHVYKSLVLLDYIIKTGSERVAQQCKENIFAIQTLKDFQFYDKDGKDQGMNVREKSKALVSLLKDEERLKTERERALKAKERFAMASQGVGSGGNDEVEIGKPAAETSNPENVPLPGPPAASEMEQARPQTAGEEELQLQLAIAMSKEEAAKSEMEQKHDDLRLQIALSESAEGAQVRLQQEQATSTLLNLVETPQQTTPQPDPWGSNSQPSIPVNDPWGAPPAATTSVPAVQNDPWGSGVSEPPLPQVPVNDPWSATAPSQPPVPQQDPWGAPATQQAANDPWAPAPVATPQVPQDPDSEFDFLRNDGALMASTAMTTQSVPPSYAPQTNGSAALPPKTKSQTRPEDFLGENSSLVNLDSLVGPTSGPTLTASNPFLMTQVGSSGSMHAPQSNPFHQQRAPAPTINQMRQQPFVQQTVPTGTFQTSFPAAGEPVLPPPLIPSGGVGASQGTQANPFL